jgi:hypothetical protein
MAASVGMMDQAELRRHIIAIQSDTSLTDEAKAKKRQALLSGKWQSQEPAAEKAKGGKTSPTGHRLIPGSIERLSHCGGVCLLQKEVSR